MAFYRRICHLLANSTLRKWIFERPEEWNADRSRTFHQIAEVMIMAFTMLDKFRSQTLNVGGVGSH